MENNKNTFKKHTVPLGEKKTTFTSVHPHFI